MSSSKVHARYFQEIQPLSLGQKVQAKLFASRIIKTVLEWWWEYGPQVFLHLPLQQVYIMGFNQLKEANGNPGQEQGRRWPGSNKRQSEVMKTLVQVSQVLSAFLAFLCNGECEFSFPSTTYWRECLFCIVYFCFLCHRLGDHRCVGLSLSFLSCPVVLCFCFSFPGTVLRKHFILLKEKNVIDSA